MAIFTSKGEASGTVGGTPEELIEHAAELLAAAEGGIKLQAAKDIPHLKAGLAGAYAQLAVAKLSLARQ